MAMDAAPANQPPSLQAPTPHTPPASQSCRVCGDTATGIHYGAWTCEGCKMFFRRSKNMENKFICPASSSCRVDRTTRRCCQACRLAKCQTVGMNFGPGRRRGRGASSAAKRFRPDSTSDLQKSAGGGASSVVGGGEGALVNGIKLEPTTGLSPAQSPRDSSVAASPSTAAPSPAVSRSNSLSGKRSHASFSHGGGGSDNPSPTTTAPPPAPAVNPESLQLMHHFTSIDYRCPDSDHRPGQPIIAGMMRVVDNYMIELVRWAKKIPGFTRLHLNHQMFLIENAWMELLMIDACFRSMEWHGERISFAHDLILDREEWPSVECAKECILMSEVTKRLCQLGFTAEEKACFKALVLINADSAARLYQNDEVRGIIAHILNALQVASERSKPGDSMHHQMLLIHMAPIRQMGIHAITTLFALMKRANFPAGEMCKNVTAPARTSIDIPAKEVVQAQFMLPGGQSISEEDAKKKQRDNELKKQQDLLIMQLQGDFPPGAEDPVKDVLEVPEVPEDVKPVVPPIEKLQQQSMDGPGASASANGSGADTQPLHLGPPLPPNQGPGLAGQGPPGAPGPSHAQRPPGPPEPMDPLAAGLASNHGRIPESVTLFQFPLQNEFYPLMQGSVSNRNFEHLPQPTAGNMPPTSGGATFGTGGEIMVPHFPWEDSMCPPERTGGSWNTTHCNTNNGWGST